MTELYDRFYEDIQDHQLYDRFPDDYKIKNSDLNVGEYVYGREGGDAWWNDTILNLVVNSEEYNVYAWIVWDRSQVRHPETYVKMSNNAQTSWSLYHRDWKLINPKDLPQEIKDDDQRGN